MLPESLILGEAELRVLKKTTELYAATQQSLRSKPERECVRVEKRKGTLSNLK